MILAAQKDITLKQVMQSASLVVPESSGILWASRILGLSLPTFIPGIDFMKTLIQLAHRRGTRIFFLGSGPGVAQDAADRLGADYPGLQIVGCHDGYFPGEGEAVVEMIRALKPEMVFVGLGMPRQEKWIASHLSSFGPAWVMGVGGSFDVVSGRLHRAPVILRRLGLEWLYRLCQEPWRWRRIAQLPVFILKVLQERFASGMSIPAER